MQALRLAADRVILGSLQANVSSDAFNTSFPMLEASNNRIAGENAIIEHKMYSLNRLSISDPHKKSEGPCFSQNKIPTFFHEFS